MFMSAGLFRPVLYPLLELALSLGRMIKQYGFINVPKVRH